MTFKLLSPITNLSDAISRTFMQHLTVDRHTGADDNDNFMPAGFSYVRAT